MKEGQRIEMPQTPAEIADDVRFAQGILADLTDRIAGGLRIESGEGSSPSPFAIRQRLVNMEIAKMLGGLLHGTLQVYLQQVVPQDIHLSWPEETLSYVGEMCARIRHLETRNWESCLKESREEECAKTYTRCQIHVGSSAADYVKHSGTNLSQWRGGSSGGSSCEVPLESDKEIRLGMCRTCIYKYGTRLGLNGSKITCVRW